MQYEPKCLFAKNPVISDKPTEFYNPMGVLIYDIQQDFNADVIELQTSCECSPCILSHLDCHCSGCVKSFSFNKPPSKDCLSLEDMKYWLDVPGKCCCLFMPCKPNYQQLRFEENSCLCPCCTLTFKCQCDHCSHFIDKQHNLSKVNFCKHEICSFKPKNSFIFHSNELYAKMFDSGVVKQNFLRDMVVKKCYEVYSPNARV